MLVMLTELLSGLALFLFGMKFMSEGPRTNATLPASSRTSGLAASIRTGIGKSNVTVDRKSVV